MRVFIIEIGNYSDRHVLAITSTKERANEIIELAKNYYEDQDNNFKSVPVLRYELESVEITEYELDEIPVFLSERIYEVTYHTGYNPPKWSANLRDQEKPESPPYLIKVSKDYLNHLYYDIAVPAKTRKAAFKTANERIMQHIAMAQEEAGI